MKSFLYILVFCTSTAAAQVNGIEFRYFYHPASRIIPPKEDTSRKKGNTQMNELNLVANFTLYQGIDSATGKVKSLTGMAGARYTTLNNEGYNTLIFPSRLFSSGFALQYYSTINRKWGYSVFLGASVNTDLKAIDLNDLFASGGVIFIRHFSPSFNMGYGLLVHNSFGIPLLWPALTVNWKFGGRFKLDIRVPDNGPGLAYKVGFGYTVNERLVAEFAFKPGAMSYDVQTTTHINNRLMTFWQLPFELDMKYKKRGIEFTAGIGFTALRSFTYSEKKLDKLFAKYPSHGLGANLFATTGIKYTF